jgi:predicted nucleic acid-binding protein
MILADTSIWIEHLRHGDPVLAGLLLNSQVLCHPAVVGELALGSLANREEVLDLLGNLPQATPATHAETMTFIERHRLFGMGIGYVDAHLLASTALTGEAALWTRDRRLRVAAQSLKLSYPAPS